MIVSQNWLLLFQFCQGIVHVVPAMKVVKNEIVVDDAIDFKRGLKSGFLQSCGIQPELEV